MRFSGIAILLALSLAAAAETVLTAPFRADEELTGWRGVEKGKAEIEQAADGSAALRVIVAPEEKEPTRMIARTLPVSALAGRRVTVSAEVSRDLGEPAAKWQGGKLMLRCRSGGKTFWPGVYMEPGKYGWKTLTLEADLPPDLEEAVLVLGIQQARGMIRYRKLKVEAGDFMLDLSRAANMGFRDPVAGDGKGGWSDQGPDNDAAGFPLGQRVFANVPFRVIDPAGTDKKSVLVFQSAHFPGGPREAALDLSGTKAQGAWLYLLHTLTWAHKADAPTGEIVLTGRNGRTQTLEVRAGRDVADWWSSAQAARVRLENGAPGAVWRNTSGSVAIYVSKFKLDPELGELRSIVFRAAGGDPVWIVAGVTLGVAEYAFPASKKLTIRENDVWKPFPAPPTAGVREGSALDLSSLTPREPVGTHGRVIIDDRGRFVYEKRPGEPLRFFSSVEVTDPFMGRWTPFRAMPEFTSRERIGEYAVQLRRQGFNMTRFHYLDATLMSDAKTDFAFRRDYLDMFDYFVYCLKREGVHINLDAMSSRIGYAAGWAWRAGETDKRNFKFQIHFDPKVRENWFKGVEKLLTRVNPYTGTRLADDPVLALVVCFNEQEFAFTRPGDFSIARPRWKKFLETKYHGDVAELRRSWGDGTVAFDSVSDLSLGDLSARTPRGNDAAAFLTEVEKEFYDWCRDSLRRIGYPGPVANYNLGQSLRYLDVRRGQDFIALNGYHAHPDGEAVSQESAVGSAARIARGFAGNHVYRKPFVNTELGLAFWNSRRYEQSFVTAAYASLNNFSGLTPFATPITLNREPLPVASFQIRSDPVLLTQNFLSTLLFLRRDAAAAPNPVRIQFKPADLDPALSRGGLGTAQSLLALVTGITVECDSGFPAEPGQVLLSGTGGTAVLNRPVGAAAGFEQLQDTPGEFRTGKFLETLRSQGLIPAANRSSYEARRYQSVTGELLMECDKNFLSVDTPRLQGVCGEAGTVVELADFAVRRMTVRGNLALAAVDGLKPIREAERLVLVFATDALNSEMEFEDETRRVRLAPGKLPVLIETGKFAVALRHPRAADFKAYALDFDGSRRCELPLATGNGELTLTVDTAALPGGPALYFELATR